MAQFIMFFITCSLEVSMSTPLFLFNSFVYVFVSCTHRHALRVFYTVPVKALNNWTKWFKKRLAKSGRGPKL